VSGAILCTAIGRTAATEALFDGRVVSETVRLQLEPFPTISRAFAPMVREQRFDVSEMAIATFLQAKAHGKDLVLLPIVVAARFQEAALLCRAEGPVAGPADLAGRRVAVRAYSQTTGMWLRGILAEEYGIAAPAIRWVTFEGAHVTEAADPPWCERAPAGADLLAMLRAGEVDAAIVGSDLPDMAGLRTVYPDPATAADRFWQRHRMMPVNHMIVVRSALARERPELVAELRRLFAAARAAAPAPADNRYPEPANRAALEPAIALALRYMTEQAMLPRVLTTEQVWEGLPA
jgi:4,5-dihydroxyphthalate decarboxylase